ncbi:MAG: DUF6288 domain-containing protein [Luteolibacter sp.]
MIRFLLLSSLGLTLFLRAAVMPDPVYQLGSCEPWTLPDASAAHLLAPGSSIVVDVQVPELGEREAAVAGSWRGICGVDLYGTADGRLASVRIEALAGDSEDVIASVQTLINGKRAGRAAWSVSASSEQRGEEAAKAFDGDPATMWHSAYGKQVARPPHWIALTFSQAKPLQGLRILPRQGGPTNGIPQKWRVETMLDDGSWKTNNEGEVDRKDASKAREGLEIRFDQTIRTKGVRFVIESDLSGGGFGSMAEITPLGVTLEKPSQAIAADTRAWLEIPAEWMAKLQGKSFKLRVSAENGQAVVGKIHVCRVHSAPSGKLFGRSNGGLGPDLLGAGLLGFDAMTEHQQTVLSVIKVRENGPAARAGLLAGDAIVAIAGKPLPVNDLNPGWTWFRQSHEACIGRATEAMLRAGRKSLPLVVLRDGKPVTLELDLPRSQTFSSMHPQRDAETAAMLEDLIGWVVRNQRANGSWADDIKRTTLAGLALLATGKQEHQELVAKAIDWSLGRFDQPSKHGNLGFWGGGYMGILYGEWFLRTGDSRVIQPMEQLRDWAYDGRLPSAWEVPALGHGPGHLPYGQKALVAPACHLLVFEALAMRCGVKDRLWDMLMPYMEMAWSDPKEGGHGALGYNRSYKDLGEFWSRSGLFAMACQLRGERSDMRDAMAAIMKQRHAWFRNSHAYGEPGGGLGLLGLQLASPTSYAKVIRDYSWWFSLAWEPGYGLRFTQPHMGAPYMGDDDLLNPLYALVLQSPQRSLHITGRSASKR